ncbi:PLD nuclease N-terminal domain-containing protein [Micrococcus antarcticus]
MVAALRDLYKRPAEQVKGPKPAWAAASMINFLGPIAYFAFGRRK